MKVLKLTKKQREKVNALRKQYKIEAIWNKENILSITKELNELD